MTLQTLGTVGLYVSAALSTFGFLAFALLARFWRSGRAGWFVLLDMLLVAWILDVSSIAHLFDPPWFAWLRVGTFAVGFPVLLAWRLWIIFDLQLNRRPRRSEAYREADTAKEEAA